MLKTEIIMKELTIEQKAERYDKAIEKAKIYTSSDYPIMVVQDVVTDIFPELKESEDERIRKALIEMIHDTPSIECEENYNVSKEDILAWLEKQDEHQQGKSALEAVKEEKVDNQNCEKPTDKIEPKFKFDDFKTKDWYVSKVDGHIHNMHYSVDNIEPKFYLGDWIICKYMHLIMQISNNDNGFYETVEIDGTKRNDIYDFIEGNFKLWTIEDAKDGDVLISKDNNPFIYNGNHDSFCVGAYCGVIIGGRFDFSTKKCNWTENSDIHPATKEQRDTLFKAMADAGYEFDFVKKELKNIE